MHRELRSSNVDSNTPMNDPKDTERRLTDLEIKATFGEDLLDHLNEQILRQQGQIELLIREVGELKRRLPERGPDASSDPREDVPPHY
jgi:SlyX protein